MANKFLLLRLREGPNSEFREAWGSHMAAWNVLMYTDVLYDIALFGDTALFEVSTIACSYLFRGQLQSNRFRCRSISWMLNDWNHGLWFSKQYSVSVVHSRISRAMPPSCSCDKIHILPYISQRTIPYYCCLVEYLQ